MNRSARWAISAAPLWLLMALPFAARASAVQYGAGLNSCAAFLDDREHNAAADIEVLDWLAGYLTGANAAFVRVNNVMGDPNLRGAVYALVDFCRTHPTTMVAVGVDLMTFKHRYSTARTSAESEPYGTGYRNCASYWRARADESLDEASFVSWLAGYLSGVNAISKSTDDVLGGQTFNKTIQWLDDYCGVHGEVRFGQAIVERLASPDIKPLHAKVAK